MSWSGGLDPRARPYFEALYAYIVRLDPSAQVSSAYRSRTEQARLYRRFLAGLMPGPVAPPGYSYHEAGRAIDVLASDEALKTAGAAWEQAGGVWGGHFKGTGKYDPIHFQV